MRLTLKCDEDCSAKVRATIKVGRRRMALRPVTKALAAGRRTTVTIKLSAKDARRLRAVLARKRRTLALTVVATDGAGNRSTRKRSIALTR